MKAATISVFAAALLSAAAGLASALPPNHWGGVFGGDWRTNEGEMNIQQDGSRISGSYSKRGGRIEGRVQGANASGVWAQHSFDRPCVPMIRSFARGCTLTSRTDAVGRLS